MYNNNLISIVCATYNSAQYIEETIHAIIVQTYLNWELILIDDCSTDDTINILYHYANLYENIIVLQNRENLGPGITRNAGILVAKGRYIAICDSDDIWYPQKLEKQLDFMQLNHAAISYTSYELIDSCGRSLKRIIRVMNKPLEYTDYLKNTIIGFSTSMIDRNKCPNVILPDLRSREDTFLWCTLLKNGYKAYGMDEVLTKYRVHETSVSANKIKASVQVWELYRKKLHIPFFKCLFFFLYYAYHAIKKRFL